MEQIEEIVPVRPLRLPDWLRRPIQTDKSYSETHHALKKNGLHTVVKMRSVQTGMSVGIMERLQ